MNENTKRQHPFMIFIISKLGIKLNFLFENVLGAPQLHCVSAWAAAEGWGLPTLLQPSWATPSPPHPGILPPALPPPGGPVSHLWALSRSPATQTQSKIGDVHSHRPGSPAAQ